MPGMDTRLSRRQLMLAASAASLTAFGRVLPAHAEDLPLVTDVPALASLVATLQYRNETEIPEKRCDGCVLYTAGSETRGKCTALPGGAVAAGGWCLSWAPRPS